MWISPFIVMVFNLLHLTELTRLSNRFFSTYKNRKVLHLTELTRLSNLDEDQVAAGEVLHLTELTRLSNLFLR